MTIEDTIYKLFVWIDSIVELYLGRVIKPFLSLHETFYTALNKTLRKVLDDNKGKIPTWFTANFITYGRTALVIPTILLLAWDYTWIPSMIVILVDFGDFLDGVVARFWVDISKEGRGEGLISKDKTSASSPSSSDDDSFEIVTTGSPQKLTSWLVLHRNRTYGGFVDAVCDKAFVIPCWISLLHAVSTSSSSSAAATRWIQYFVLIFLALSEVASGCIRFRAYYAGVAVPAPKVEGFDFSTSALQADHVGKAKQTFEMVGTALFILPWMRLFGLCFLLLALPLAYESVRRKVHDRVLYVNGTGGSTSNNKGGTGGDKLDYKTLKFWMQAKAMGSKLIVGFVDKKTDMILNACACSCVDEVVAEAPEKLDLMFLEKHNIHYVISTSMVGTSAGGAGGPQFVTDEVVNSGRCLVLGDDGVVRQYKLKDTIKKE